MNIEEILLEAKNLSLNFGKRKDLCFMITNLITLILLQEMSKNMNFIQTTNWPKLCLNFLLNKWNTK